MAGSYNDAPAARMAVSGDGSIGLMAEADGTSFVVGRPPRSPWLNLSQASMDMLDSEDASDNIFGNWLDTESCIIFPEKRDIDGLFLAWDQIQGGGTSTSVDTTNGVDGTWVDQSYTGFVWSADDEYRDNIQAFSLTGIRSVRHYNTANQPDWAAFHCYGTFASGETPDRIIFLDEGTGLEFGSGGSTPDIMDFGDRPRGSIFDHEFRVRNNSTVAGNNLTATTIVLTSEVREGVMNTWMTYNEAGGAFSASETVTSLAPETNSALLVMRLDIADAAQLFVWAARTKVAVTTWA